MVEVIRVVEVVRMVEVIRVVEVVYRYEENLGVKGPNKKNKNNVGLRMTMPQAVGKNNSGHFQFILLMAIDGNRASYFTCLQFLGAS